MELHILIIIVTKKLHAINSVVDVSKLLQGKDPLWVYSRIPWKPPLNRRILGGRLRKVRLSLFICLFICRFQEKLQQRAKEGKPVFEDYRWIRNPSDTSTLETEEEKRCLKDVVSLLSFFV